MNQITLLEYQYRIPCLQTQYHQYHWPAACQNRKMDRSKIDENILELRGTFDGIIGTGVKFC